MGNGIQSCSRVVAGISFLLFSASLLEAGQLFHSVPYFPFSKFQSVSETFFQQPGLMQRGGYPPHFYTKGIKAWSMSVVINPPKILEQQKNKIIIFSSMGGGGHVVAAKALSQVLQDTYEVIIIYPFQETLKKIDPVRIVTGGKKSCEDLYNWLLENGFCRLINVLGLIGQFLSEFQAERIQNFLTQEIEKQKPVAVISVIPYINGPLQSACRKLKIPGYLVPTDFDPRTFLVGVYAQETEPSLFVTVPFNDARLVKFVQHKCSKQQILIGAGFPVRTEFSRSHDIQELKKRWDIPEQKRVILLIMGAVGANATFDYAWALAHMPGPAHLIVCVGKNKTLKQKISKITPRKGVSVQIVPYTENVHELFAVADLLITKPGSMSVAEALTVQVPMLLVGYGSTPLTWERFNYEFIEKNNYGMFCKSPRDVIRLSREVFENYNFYKNALRLRELPHMGILLREHLNQYLNKIRLLKTNEGKFTIPDIGVVNHAEEKTL